MRFAAAQILDIVVVIPDTGGRGHYYRYMNEAGPGKSYRKGITIKQLFEMFPDDATAEAWFTDARWPNGIACPHCGSLSVANTPTHKTMPYRCRDCRKRFSGVAPTMQSSA